MQATAHDESEYRTRRKRIDPRLAAAGWTVTAHNPATPLFFYTRHAVTEFPTDNGPADYALFVAGQLLGVIEAKRVTLGPQNVLTQAERYARGLAANPFNFRGIRAPFLYSTNGEILWFQDARHPLNRSRRLAHFHTPAALEEMLARDFDAACYALAALPASTLLRPYQTDANTAVERALAERSRLMLLAMATGTGKTVTLVNQAYRLMKTGAGKRILFLVDRRALAAQAVRTFSSFEPEPNRKFPKIYEVYSQRFRREDFGDDDKFDPEVLPQAYLNAPQAKHAFVYVCTIQRMAVNLFGRSVVWTGADPEPLDEDAEQVKIPIHAFDVIIADECHRGYTTAELSLWRNTLDHFDAIKIGLTATPAAHTKAYFQDVVFRYEYARAVREGHLVDYDVVKVKSEVRMQGVFLKEGESVSVVDPETGTEQLDHVEDERTFETTEVERKVTSPDSNRKILEEIKKYADEHQARYGRFPKTLIFAANDVEHMSHADQLVKLAVDVFGRGPSFVKKITGSPTVDRPLQRIREFRNRPEPGIVVTVDMLSTGVDIPDLEFIVFLRPVKSRILFEQMLGRGTRKGEKFPDKSHFTVFDCFDGTLLAYFKQATAITAEPPETPGRPLEQVIEDIWANRDRPYNVRCLVRRLQRIDKEMDGSGRAEFAALGIPEGDLGKYAAALPGLLERDFGPTMKMLRNPTLQDRLVNYPRPKKTFWKAVENEDTVSSEYLVRDGLGREHKPEDYLELFARFVRDNPSKVEAIGILLDRPQDWSTAALSELRAKLTATPEQFSVDLLQKAHERHYHKALVDIISMVKHAADEEQPLLTASERVQRALDKIGAGRTFTPEQEQWLERIRRHLVANLSIGREDFEDMPILNDAGGWGSAIRVFGGELDKLMEELNAAMAA